VFVPSPIERTRDGDFRLRLSDAERELLRALPGELLALLAVDPGDPTLRRLSPAAYEDDAEAEGEFRRLMQDELMEGRREALRLLAETAARDRLTAEELDAWLRALTDLRLALGTRLEVTEETYERDIDPRDPVFASAARSPGGGPSGHAPALHGATRGAADIGNIGQPSNNARRPENPVPCILYVAIFDLEVSLGKARAA